MTDATDGLGALYGRRALDRDGGELGTIEAVYLDPETEAPEWAVLKLGVDHLALVPLAGADSTAEGVRLAFDQRLVRGAPGAAVARTELPRELEAELYHYYSLDYAGLRDGDVGPRLPSGPADAA